jgi:hypothetical protein
LKDFIEKFLVSVCGFTADAAKETTKNQGYDELDEFYLLNDKGGQHPLLHSEIAAGVGQQEYKRPCHL